MSAPARLEWNQAHLLRVLELAISQAHDAVIVTTADLEPPGPTIIYVNQAFTAMTGYSAEEAIGQTPRILQGPATDRAVLDDLKATLAAGGTFSGATVNYRKDGTPYDLEWRIAPVRDDDGRVTHFVSLQQDVSDRHRADEALRRSERLLERAQRFGRVGGWRVELQTGSVECSDEMFRLFGLDPSDRPPDLRKLFGSTMSPSAVRALDAARERAVVDGQPYEIELEIVRGDGVPRFMYFRGEVERDETGAPVAVAGICQDITERRNAAAQLRSLEARARAASEVSLDALMIVAAVRDKAGDVVDFTIVDTNPKAEQLLGESRAALHGARLSGTALATAPRDCIAALRRAVSTRSPTEQHAEIVLSPGARRWLHCQAVPFDDGLALTIRDVTEAKMLEQQFRHAQKMESVGRLAGGIAHDFNNIVASILSLGEFVDETLPHDHPAKADVRAILAGAERAANLTTQLLAFSRLQVLRPQIIDLNQLIKHMGGMLRRVLGEDVELRVDPGANLALVKVDPGQIEQVLMNLIVNARDAMAGAGVLAIETANAHIDQDFARLNVPAVAGEYVVVCVTDTGHGIPKEIQERVFEPFFTTKPPGSGTGLGLSTAYGIVRQSGGFMWLSSGVGRGTTFKIYLPRADETAASLPPTPHAAVPRGSETILLVEDDEAVREVARRALQRHGYAVLAADDPEAAVLLSERHEGVIHLLLTDVVMPKMSGAEVAERVRELRPTLRVLYMSGYAEELMMERGVLRAGVTMVPKPFTPIQLLARVREVLDAPPGSAE